MANPVTISLMKTLLTLLFLLTSLSSFAQHRLSDYPVDSNYCNGRESCHKGHIWLISSGDYYARGYGRTCEEAMEDSEDNFIRTFGDMSCGLVSGPYSWSCERSRDGRRFVSWHRCSPDSGPARSAPRSRCAVIGGRLMCG